MPYRTITFAKLLPAWSARTLTKKDYVCKPVEIHSWRSSCEISVWSTTHRSWSDRKAPREWAPFLRFWGNVLSTGLSSNVSSTFLSLRSGATPKQSLIVAILQKLSGTHYFPKWLSKKANFLQSMLGSSLLHEWTNPHSRGPPTHRISCLPSGQGAPSGFYSIFGTSVWCC